MLNLLHRAALKVRERIHARRLFPDSLQRTRYVGLLEGLGVGGEVLSLKVGAPYDVEILLRARKDDASVLDEILGGEAYRSPVPETDVRTIIDLGGHIGFGSLYLLLRFPQPGRFIVLEPSAENFALLERNLAAIEGRHSKAVTACRAAIWSGTGTGTLVSGSHSWGHTATLGDGGLPLIGMKDMLDRHAIDQVDILKVDIEGAERELFADSCAEWIGRVKRVYIEFHEGTFFIDGILRRHGFTPAHRKGHATFFYTRS